MKCESCDNEKIRILGKEYCPVCEKRNFDIKVHSGVETLPENSIRAVLWGLASALTLIVLFVMLGYLFPANFSTPMLSAAMGIIAAGTAGFIVINLDKDKYLLDNFIVAFILSLSLSFFDYFVGDASYLLTFFSGLLVFYITLCSGSLVSLFFNKNIRKR